MAELAARYGVSGLVKLNWNEGLFGLLPGVAEAVEAELAQAQYYPGDIYLAFRELVGRWTGADPASIVPAHGIQALVRTVASVFLDEGDKVVLPSPTYGLYRQVCQAQGAEIVSVPTAGYRLDLPAMLTAARDAKMVVVCDPNNPTGDALTPAEWRGFVRDLPPDCVAVVDEAYADYLAPRDRPDRIGDIVAGRPVVIVRTFSKLFGIAGLRLGYAIADPDLVPCFDAVQEPFNVNRLALAAGIACLSDPQVVEDRRREVARAREGFAGALAEMGVRVWPSQANFLLADVGGDDRAWHEGLLREGFLVRPGSDFGLPGHLRITIGPDALMRQVAAAMRRVHAAVADSPPGWSGRS